MYRRLFFLCPNKIEAQRAVQELMDAGLSAEQMHALSTSGVNLQGLPTASPSQRKDMHTKIENSLWHLNLGIFKEVEQILHHKNSSATEEGISWTPSGSTMNV